MVNTSINLRDTSGALLDLSQRILEHDPTLSQPSVIDSISQKTGKGFFTGFITKKTKRTQGEYSANAGVGDMPSFIGAMAQVVGKVFIDKKYRTDNLVYSKIDMALLRQAKGGDLIVGEIADFLLTGRELDVKDLLADAITKAEAMKIYSSVAKAQAADLVETVATGAQPVQATNDTAGALPAILGGKRSVIVTDLDASPLNRLSLLRAGIQYFTQLGSARSAEPFYPYSINGLPLANLVILTTYINAVNTKDGVTTNFINIDSQSKQRTINGMVGFVDAVAVLITNQIPVKSAYVLMSNRVISRDLDTKTQWVGQVKENAGAVVMRDGTTKNVAPDQVLVQMLQGRAQGVKYFEEILDIKDQA